MVQGMFELCNVREPHGRTPLDTRPLHTQDGSIDISKALRERLQLFAAGTTPSVPWDSAAKGCWADLAVKQWFVGQGRDATHRQPVQTAAGGSQPGQLMPA